MEGFKLHKSSMGVYLRCPKQFEYAFIKNVKAPTTIAMYIGKRVHNAVEEFYKKVKSETLVGIANNGSEVYKYFRSLLPENGDVGIAKLFENFATFEENRWLRDWAEFGSEKALDYFLPVLNEESLEHKKYPLAGRLDRVFRTYSDQLILLELKSKEWTGSKGSLARLRKELAFYTILLEDNGYKIDYWGCYYIKNNKIWSEPVNKASVTRTLKQALDIYNAIQNNEFPKRESVMCRYCPYARLCLWDEELW